MLNISIPATFDPSKLSFPTPLFPAIDPRTAKPGTQGLVLQLWRITVENYSDEAVKGAGQKGWYGFVSRKFSPFFPLPPLRTSASPPCAGELYGSPVSTINDAALRRADDPVFVLARRALALAAFGALADLDHARPVPLASTRVPPQAWHDLDPRALGRLFRDCLARHRATRRRGRTARRERQTKEELDLGCARDREGDRRQRRRRRERSEKCDRDESGPRPDQPVGFRFSPLGATKVWTCADPWRRLGALSSGCRHHRQRML